MMRIITILSPPVSLPDYLMGNGAVRMLDPVG